MRFALLLKGSVLAASDYKFQNFYDFAFDELIVECTAPGTGAQPTCSTPVTNGNPDGSTTSNLTFSVTSYNAATGDVSFELQMVAKDSTQLLSDGDLEIEVVESISY